MNPTWLDDLWARGGARSARGRVWSAALWPAEALFRLAVASREALLGARLLRVRRAPLPVISVGGLEAGGTGKTPLVLELVRLAVRAGYQPAVLSRGYGARSLGSRKGRFAVRHVPERAGPGEALLYGDEPVWLAARVSRLGGRGVWIAPHRADAAVEAARAGSDLALLDDAFQHRRLHRDGEVVTLHGPAPLANRRLLPRGPLREPPGALRRADVIVLADADPAAAEAGADEVRPFLRPGVPVLSWRGEPSLEAARGAPPSAGEGLHLLAGIAHPERLLASLASLGAPLRDARLFPDHHRFRRADLRGLESRILVTTEKDWSRLEPILPEGARVMLLRQRIRWNEPGAEAGWIEWLRARGGL